MMPTMSSMRLERITVARKSSSVMTANDPNRAPSTMAMLPPVPATVPPAMSMTIATPKEAPLVIPRMEGPARGLRKDVWSISPEAASEAPQRMAVIACGRRDSSTMYRHDSFSVSSPVMIDHTSEEQVASKEQQQEKDDGRGKKEEGRVRLAHYELCIMNYAL